MAKLTDLINKSAHITFSYEVTPDLPIEELTNVTVEPLFYSVTWHAKTHKNENMEIGPLRLAKQLRAHNKQVLLHLSCDLLRKDFLKKLLKFFKENEIRNLFVILGEKYDPATSDFESSNQLIKSIREETRDYFCIGVAGSPDCTDDRLQQLSQKVNSGADYILTQAFFEPKLYATFTSRLKAVGVNIPVIPGVFPFETHEQLSGFINMCKIKVSDHILEYIKDEAKTITGKELIQNLIASIAAETDMKHFHLFTLNKLARSASFVNALL